MQAKLGLSLAIRLRRQNKMTNIDIMQTELRNLVKEFNEKIRSFVEKYNLEPDLWYSLEDYELSITGVSFVEKKEKDGS